MPPLERVKEDLATGMSKAEVAEAYGVTRESLTGFMTRHKLSRRSRITYPPDEEIIAALRERESIHGMAVRFGIHKDTLWRRIYDRGLRRFVEPPPPTPIILTGLQPSPIKVIVTAPDGSKISVPRIPTIHGHYEARP